MDYARKYAIESGPIIVQADTYRYHGHTIADASWEYRTKEEVAEWRKRDPIDILKAMIIDNKVLNEDQCAEMEDKANEYV